MKALSHCWLLPLAAFYATSAQAQAVRLKTEVSQRTVEQGQSFQLQFTALVSSGQPAPASPRLPAPPGATVHGPSVSSQQQVVMRGGGIEQRHGVTATWSITPTRLGKLRVGPPSILVGNQQHQGEAVVVEVVSAGKGPSQRRARPGRRLPTDPFDLFRGRGSLFPPGLFNDPLDDTWRDDRAFVPNYPGEFAIESAPDPVAFLRSQLDQRSAVVGEQVTLRIYAYGNRGLFREANSNEPQAADFVSFPIVENSGHERTYQVDIGDDIWHAVKVRELALFPIRTGNLSLGKMRMAFMGRGYASSIGQPGLTRQSELLTIAVSEPPLTGRPAGYRIGDVGRYELSARVEPRSLRQGEAVSVAVTLSGTGNLPLKLPLPERDGVEWLEPQIRGEVAPEGSIVQGSRHFQYVVRLQKAGTVELGELQLPYWDPVKRVYETARTKLGSVRVSKSDGPSTDSNDGQHAGESSNAVKSKMSPRKQLGPAPPDRAYLTDQNWFWAVLGIGPVSVAATGFSLSAIGRLKRRLATRRKDATGLAAKALARAEKANAEGDHATALVSVERALFLAVEGATGLKARGFLREELAQKLTEKNVPEDTANRLGQLLARCESSRFTGATDASAVREIVAESKKVVLTLARTRRARNAMASP